MIVLTISIEGPDPEAEALVANDLDAWIAVSAEEWEHAGNTVAPTWGEQLTEQWRILCPDGHVTETTDVETFARGFLRLIEQGHDPCARADHPEGPHRLQRGLTAWRDVE